MIVTLTVNPSVDRTMAIDGEIKRGDVFRALGVGDEAGGKGSTSPAPSPTPASLRSRCSPLTMTTCWSRA